MSEKQSHEDAKHHRVTLAAALAAAGVVIGTGAALRHNKRKPIKLLESPNKLNTHGRRKIDMHTAVNHIAATILEMGEATAKEVRELTGLSQQSAHYLLKLLEKDKLIVHNKQSGKDNEGGSYYEPAPRLINAADHPEHPPLKLAERRAIVKEQIAASDESA